MEELVVEVGLIGGGGEEGVGPVGGVTEGDEDLQVD